jgi:hypothetical protein
MNSDVDIRTVPISEVVEVGMDLIPFHSSLVDCYATTYLVLHC